MHKIIFANGAEFTIEEGATLGNITVVADTLEELEPLKEVLAVKSNFDKITFTVNDEVTGEYTDMILMDSVFKVFPQFDEDTGALIEIVKAVFGIREKTDIEKRLDALEAGQEIQDVAIVDLACIVGESEA